MTQQDKKKKVPPSQIFPNKQVMPLIGFGTYKLEDEQQLTNLLRKGLQIGYCKHIDTARLYNNEIQLGQAIKTVINEGRVRREQLFIATKIFNHRTLNPLMEIKEALRLMQLKYVDLLYLHWPLTDIGPGLQFNHRSMQECWADMELCVTKGYTKHLGISNFNGQAMMDLLAFATIKPVALQIQVHPYLQNTGLVELAQKNKIIVIAHTPLARGDSKGDDSLLKDETVLDIAAKHGRTPAQVVLKSTIARGIGVIPKTGNIPRMQENWLSWTLELQDDDIKKIKTLNKNNRVCDGTSFATQFAMFD